MDRPRSQARALTAYSSNLCAAIPALLLGDCKTPVRTEQAPPTLTGHAGGGTIICAMSALRFLLRYARKYTGALAVAVASMVFLVAVQLVGPWIVREIIVVVTGPGAGQATLDRITQLALLALGVYLLRAGFTFLRSYMSHIAGWGVVSDARQEIYDHLQRLSLRFYENTQTGQLMSRMVNDSEMFERLIAHALPDTLVNVLLLAGVCAVLATLNEQLLLLSLAPVPLIVLGMRGFAKYVRPAFRQRQQELSELSATLNDNLSGIREIKAFVQEEAEAARIGDHIRRFLLSNLKALRMMAVFHPFVEFAASLGRVIIIYFGARLVVGPAGLPVEDLVAFFLYLDLFYRPV
ncbi:MAG: ABC transporter ATP-binding protein, partial [Anaerolineales bacterium]